MGEWNVAKWVWIPNYEGTLNKVRSAAVAKRLPIATAYHMAKDRSFARASVEKIDVLLEMASDASMEEAAQDKMAKHEKSGIYSDGQRRRGKEQACSKSESVIEKDMDNRCDAEDHPEADMNEGDISGDEAAPEDRRCYDDVAGIGVEDILRMEWQSHEHA
ncbi:hypothetical protein PIB30_021143 [Stylosanthes scabra]|uniref:Uncharacterized protein n=1 Tax=Stylosanthes scabra TaxID=79078 RepID=A0ABU6R928_9FABA|nr:hypothetical protein [Stylosanthes scabra]